MHLALNWRFRFAHFHPIFEIQVPMLLVENGMERASHYSCKSDHESGGELAVLAGFSMGHAT